MQLTGIANIPRESLSPVRATLIVRRDYKKTTRESTTQRKFVNEQESKNGQLRFPSDD